MALLIYLLKLIAYSGFFALIYRILLIRLPVHVFNRRFLLAAIILPFILPLLHIPALEYSLPVYARFTMQELVVGMKQKSSTATWPALSVIMSSGYFFIAGCLLLRVLWMHIRLSSMLSKAAQITIDGTPIHVLNGFGPGSYNRHIFFPDEQVDPFILQHEQAHVRYQHHLDLWLLQIAKAICWIDPFIYYLAAQLKLVHEYQSDAAAGDLHESAYAEALLAQVFHSKQITIAHSFFHHPIKNRILMLQKANHKSRYSAVKLGAIAAILLCSGSMIIAQTAKPQKRSTTKTAQKADAVLRKADQMPQFDGNVNEWLSSHLTYPEAARKKGQEGRVIVEFVVNADGAITRPRAVRSSSVPALDAEALRVVKQMPNWKPGKLKGKPVSIYFNLPITFKLA